MRSQEFLPEIERLTVGGYEGGKKYLYAPQTKKLTPLPGGSGLLYHVGGSNYSPMVTMWDPEGLDGAQEPGRRNPNELSSEYQARLKKWKAQQARGVKQPQLIAKLALSAVDQRFPIPGALQVETITVDEDYRGRGLAKALYGIVLSIMRRPLLAGKSQTPGGRRNWASLSQIPGVEVNGYVAIDDYDLDPANDPSPLGKKQSEAMIDTLMGRLGAEYIGADTRGRTSQRFFAFPVQPNQTGAEMEAMVKTGLSKIYGQSSAVETGLYAIWNGAA
jgi:GNAT superfamily N-acetyltransferase